MHHYYDYKNGSLVLQVDDLNLKAQVNQRRTGDQGREQRIVCRCGDDTSPISRRLNIWIRVR